MREEIQRYHNDCLATHQSIMFETLLHRHNIISESVQALTFEDSEGSETDPLKGYLALKQVGHKKVKYFLEEEFFDELPIRVNDTEELYLKDSKTKKSVVLRAINPIPFRIKPEQTFTDVHNFIDELAPFEHSSPENWTLLKLCAVMGFVGKTFLGISSLSEFGKSGIFTLLHGITQKSIVFQPRSDAGILIQINENGNMVFDEVHECDTKTKKVMENFTLQVTANIPVYFNGAVRAKYLKQKYNVRDQSINYLYNIYSYYKNPEKEFFDNIFSNNKAIDSRILKLKFDGVLTEKFDKNFDIVETAEENKLYYMKVAKMLLWLKQLKQSNKYARRYDYQSDINLRERHRLIYKELTWLIDRYAENYEEYVVYVSVLDKCINDYKEMVGEQKLIKEEDVK